VNGNNGAVVLLYLFFPQSQLGDEEYIKILFYHVSSCLGYIPGPSAALNRSGLHPEHNQIMLAEYSICLKARRFLASRHPIV